MDVNDLGYAVMITAVDITLAIIFDVNHLSWSDLSVLQLVILSCLLLLNIHEFFFLIFRRK